MDFRELAYTVSIAKHQGIGKAAKEMHVSQSTLSKFVQNLENNLGQPIFRKLGNKFLLTYAGERYVETAKTILTIKQDLDKEMADIVKEDIGELKLAFQLYGNFSILAQALLRFRKQYPRVKINVLEGHSSVLEQMIKNGDVDLAFITIQFRHPDISYEVINNEEVLLIMAPDHPRAKEGGARQDCKYPWMDVSKLEQELFILQWPEQHIRQISNRIFQDAKIKPTNIITMKNIYASIQLAIDSYGLAFMRETPLRFTNTLLSPACFSVGNPYTTVEFAAVYRAGMHLTAYHKHFIRIVKELVTIETDLPQKRSN